MRDSTSSLQITQWSAGDRPEYDIKVTLAATRYVPVSASGAAVQGPCLYLGIQCVTAGTVQVADGITAGSLTNITPALAMTAGQVVPFCSSFPLAVELVTGAYCVVTSGTYNLLVA